MPLGKDSSIIADSTVSSSPQLDVDATLQVKRATRTYGRRREEPQLEEKDSSMTNLEDLSGILSVHNTAPPGLRDEIPPSSPRTHLADSDVGGRVGDIATTSFGEPTFDFGWKSKLKELDQSDDEDTEMSTGMKADDASNTSGFGLALLLQPTDDDPLPRTPNDRKSLSSTASLVEDVFQAGPSAGRTGTPSSAALQDLSSPSSSPTPAISTRSRKTNRLVIIGSDSEQEHPKDSSSTTASASSSKRKSRSSYTPPTSDDDVPANIIRKSRSAGKKKDAAIPRARVPPLQFTEDTMTELRKSSAVGKKKKTKAPTLKEQEEMIKERSRIMVQTAVSIPRAEVSKYSLDSFFSKISAKQPKPTTLTSDPIVQFSSPEKEMEAAPAQDSTRPASPGPRAMVVRRSPSPDNNDSGDDSDLPEIGEVLTAGIKKDAKQKELLELKKRFLQQRPSAVQYEGDDDDDLEIVQSNPKLAVKEEQEHRRAVHKRPSEGRKRQMQLAQINPSKQIAKGESAFSPVRKGHHGQGPLSILQQVDAKDMSQKTLNQLLAAEAQKKAQMEMEKKVAEWKKYGGRIVNQGEIQAQGLNAAIQSVVEKGLKVAESRAVNAEEEDEDADEDDQDWNPAERGSASPEPVDADENVGSDNEEEENDENKPLEVEEADISDVAEEVPSKVRQSRRMINSDSEEENDENAPMTSRGSSSKEKYRRATSSCDIGTEEEEDKENNTKLMYDRGEDKENTAVVRHGVLEQPLRPIFSGDDIPTPPISPSLHRSATWNARTWEREVDEENTPNQRRPLEDLISEESPMLSQILPTNLTQSFTAKLQQASPLPSTLAPAPVLKPLFDNDDSGMNISGGFSQFSQADGEPFGAVLGLQPGFSELFESTTQKGDMSKEVSSDVEHIRNLKRTDTLGLTQDFTALNDLRPAFQGGDHLIRKADAIFEKEQAFILEDATRKPQQKPELYVNDHGFLTQTRPIDGTPEIYRPLPTQSGLYNSRQNHLLSAMQSGSRTPLRTLSMTSIPDSPTETSPLRRLQRFDRTPPRRPLRDLPDSPILVGPSRRVVNAFDALVDGAQKLKRHDELKNRPELAAFLEDEAAESDDEENFGFMKPKKTTEDDENGEDLDATLEELMDDKEMDQATVAPELVHAKFMEQLEVEDQEIEKFHQGVIQGEQRLKRRRGVEVDDSEEDSEVEEENERARRAMKKLRKSDRHDIKTLENDESTRAFAESYNMTLKDDDAEFLYLDQEGLGIPNDLMQVDREGGNEEEEEEDENNEPETVTHDEISRRVRQMQEEGIEDTAMDPQDVSWVDQEDEDEEAPRVKTINTRVRSRGRAQVALEPSDMDGMGAAFRKQPANMTTNSSKQWYAQEQKTRNAGTSRSVGGSAITGHAKAKSKTGNGTVRAGSMMKRSNTASSSTSGSSSGSRPVRPAPSVLAVISDKSRHFA